MTSGGPTLCFCCARRSDTSLVEVGGPRCEAYPAGIPDDIWAGGFDHRQPFPGDGGIRFLLGSDPDDPKLFADWENSPARR